MLPSVTSPGGTSTELQARTADGTLAAVAGTSVNTGTGVVTGLKVANGTLTANDETALSYGALRSHFRGNGGILDGSFTGEVEGSSIWRGPTATGWVLVAPPDQVVGQTPILMIAEGTGGPGTGEPFWGYIYDWALAADEPNDPTIAGGYRYSAAAAEHLARQVDDRIVGLTAATAMPRFTARTDGSLSYTLNGSFWLSAVDVSGIGVNGGALITARHMLYAWHVTVNNGDVFRFVSPAGTGYAATVASSVRIGSTDLRLVTFTGDVNASVAPVRVLPPGLTVLGLTDTNGFPLTGDTVPCVTQDQNSLNDFQLLEARLTDAALVKTGTAPSNRTAWQTTVASGDSGQPVFALVRNRVVLLTTWESTGGGPGVWNPTNYAAIRAAVEADGYRLTPLDWFSDDLGPGATAVTQGVGNNTTKLATTAFVKAALDALIAAAPGALDTLDELAAALGDDPAFATTVTTALAARLVAANNLSDVANASTARGNLGLTIGTHVQAYDAELTAIAGLASAADRLPYFTGSGTASLATYTAFARSLDDDADAATARATLGLSTFAFGLSLLGTVANGTVVLSAKAAVAGTFNQIRGLKTSAGTCTVTVQINGTNVTGLASLSVTSTPQDATATAANTWAVGDRLTWVIASVSSAADLEATLQYTR